MNVHNSYKISPQFDPWEAYSDIREFGKSQLTNIEFTTTTLCNMRCEHCAVGYTLSPKDPDALPLSLLLKRLDEIPNLKALSITGGEPILSRRSVKDYVLPILKYAKDRNVYTQLNSNLTLELSRYDEVYPLVDVLHVSHNWGTIDDFVEGGFSNMERKPSFEQREALFKRMITNAQELSKNGVFVSAETMLNKRTFPHLEKIYKQIVEEMRCARMECHPMYAVDWASNLPALSTTELREAIHTLLDVRNEDVWMLFGTLPFYACSSNEEDLSLLKRLRAEKNVTLRNDPDGRSRLNVNIFNGDIIVTDFGDVGPLGNVVNDTLLSAYDKWQKTSLAKSLSCHCPQVSCLGPNVLVKDMYYKDVDFLKRSSNL